MAAAGLLFGLAALWLRVFWLETIGHAHYAERAERNQEQRVLVRPVRGNLLDRQGRLLARDLLTYSVSVAPREMKQPRAVARGLAEILRTDAKKLERAFTSRPRYLLVARRVPPEAGRRIAERGWRGVYLAVETQRDYMLGAAAAEVIGRTDVDNAGVDGLELQLDAQLRGRPGWTTLIRNGRGRTVELPRGMRRSPENGNQVVLSLDADLQAILETHLTHAVDTLDAVRGFAMFLDPRTGEVLASASVPHLPPGKARNLPFTDQYEPGSTFKAVTAAAALEENLARPNQYFQAGNAYQVAPGAFIHDAHPRAGFTFYGAVQHSSNIVMARLGQMIGAERMYRYATSLGFGSLTGIDFPGEAGGRLRSPEHWSARSLPTIAIGHEVSVTPLQLALAYGAIANGGVLMQPMLVREVRSPQGDVLHRYVPQASHRVFSEGTTRLLRGMLEAVVDSGTAKAARVPGLAVAGKTGTAQKYDPNVRGYGKGMYLSSFVGFAPAESPTLVGVVVIDEPHGKHYYGGEVAAPVFREVMLDLQRLPRGPLESNASQVAVKPPAPAPVVVPDLRLLPPHEVERRLAAFGLRARFEGQGARALAQAPAAGQAAERGAGITVWLSPPEDSVSRVLPDLTGMPVREALRQLTLREVQAHIRGTGHVVRQQPAAGTALPLADGCRLWCEPGVPAAATSGTAVPVALARRVGEP